MVTQLFFPISFCLKNNKRDAENKRPDCARFTNLLAHVLPGFLVAIAWLLSQFTNLKNRDDDNTSTSSGVTLVMKCLVLIIIITKC